MVNRKARAGGNPTGPARKDDNHERNTETGVGVMCGGRGNCEGACEATHGHRHECPVCHTDYACKSTDCKDERACDACWDDGFDRCEYCGEWARSLRGGLCASCGTKGVAA